MRQVNFSHHALSFVLTFSACMPVAASETLNWTIDGIERSALVFAPADPPKSGGSPVVFAFHGHGGNSRHFARSASFQTAWPEAIVVYMQGVPTATMVDPEGKRPGWQRDQGELGNRDVKFFDRVLATVREKYKVNDRHIYATGFSNGGVFTYLLWAERPNIFAALAPCGSLPRATLKITVPKPVFIVSGEKDPLVSLTNAQRAIAFAQKLNHTSNDGEPGSDGTMLYKSKDGTPVETLVHPGGHLLPPAAPKLIVEFFRAHQLAK